MISMGLVLFIKNAFDLFISLSFYSISKITQTSVFKIEITIKKHNLCFKIIQISND